MAGRGPAPKPAHLRQRTNRKAGAGGLDTDVDALGRLALLWDDFYKDPRPKVLGEIRLQEARFGLSPLDRSRLQWDIVPPRKDTPAETPARAERPPRPTVDPRAILQAVK